LTLQYRTDLQALHVVNLMSSHSATPQAAQKEDDVSNSFSALIFFIAIDAFRRYYRQSATLSKIRQRYPAAEIP
jgi:hypothetical protein